MGERVQLRDSKSVTGSLLAPAPVSVEETITDRLVAALAPRQICLFGSQARGDADERSDFDIAVLTDAPASECLRLEMAGIRALWGVDASIDLCVWSWTGFHAQTHLKASFPATILREGRKLYER